MPESTALSSRSIEPCYGQNHRAGILGERRGQAKLDERNAEIMAFGLKPRTTKFETQKETQGYIPVAVSTEKKLATAAYARLSVEKEDDDSIHTQITLLKNYISEHADLELSDTYIDNGFTGTRFDRPDFVRMMDDVRCGKIQCIVVKDLSRFGRDFLETGYYIETLLPRLNVRLISINDDFDSFREGDINSIAIPIKNMVNELYAKDFSRKVTAYNDLHRERGTLSCSVRGVRL